MAESMLCYDPDRVRSLVRRTSETIEFLDRTRCDDPAGSDAMATVRDITHRLSTTWMPAFANVDRDASMTGWNAATVGGAADCGPGPRDAAYGEMSDDELLAHLDPRAWAGGPVGDREVPMAMLVELARRWDDLGPERQREAVVHLLGWESFPDALVLVGEQGPLAFFPRWIDDVDIDPEFAQQVITVVAAGHDVSPELQPLVDRVGAEYADVLVAGINGVDDPTVLAGVGLLVPFTVGRVTASAFVSRLGDARRDAIVGTLVLDTADFTMGNSIVAQRSDGASWSSTVDFFGHDLAGYEGGGFVVGPDGREYPIVIPTVTTANGTFTADTWTTAGAPSVADLGGGDDGWDVIGYASGVERVQAEPGPMEVVMGGLAASTGLVRPAPPNAGLPSIVMNPAHPPYLSEEPPTLPTTENVPDADGMPLLLADVTVMSMNMDNQTERAYQVVFEQNDDGRIRARIETFSLWENADGDLSINPQHLYVDAGGRLMSQGISYGAPFAIAPDQILAGSPDVHAFHFGGYDFTAFPVPDAVIPARPAE